MSETVVTDRELIKELKYRYCYALGFGEAKEFADLFTTDGVFEVQHANEQAQGHEELREVAEHIANFDTTCLAHFALNPVITIDDDTATGRWFNIIIIESTDGRVEWGHSKYDDVYRRVDGEWKIELATVTRRHTLDLSGMTTKPGGASPLGDH